MTNRRRDPIEDAPLQGEGDRACWVPNDRSNLASHHQDPAQGGPNPRPPDERHCVVPEGATASGSPTLLTTVDGGPPGRGALAFMANNHVASNLLMALMIAGGLFALPRIKQEVFPEFKLDSITITVPYPGASPTEVEQAALLALEQAVQGLDGVKELQSTATEGAGVVTVELQRGADPAQVLAEIKSAVDRMPSLPTDAERPVVQLDEVRAQVLSLIVYGDVPAKALRAMAEQTRDGLMAQDGVTIAELYHPQPLEVSVEIPQATLRRYGLTTQQVADAISNSAVELSAGSLRTERGEVLVRIAEHRELGEELEDIIVVSTNQGAEVRLSDMATIKDTFAESEQEMTYNGKPAQRIDVYRVGAEGPTDVAAAVKGYVAEHAHLLPSAVKLAVWGDDSELFAERLGLLLSNSMTGLLLVIAVLGLLLQVRLAFWVTLGIPVSFLGSLVFLPAADISVNMISLFGFIVALGMVVDDAIIVSEAVHKHHRDGLRMDQAAIAGAREVAGPVTFSTATTVVAFLPLLFVPGTAGKFFRNIPWVVIAVLLVSLVEGLFILPSHLGQKRHLLTTVMSAPFRLLSLLSSALFGVDVIAWLLERQRKVSIGVETFVTRCYGPVLQVALRHRYSALAGMLTALLLTLGLILGGWLEFTFFPKIDGDVVVASVEMPVGTPGQVTREHQREMIEQAGQLLAELNPEGSRGIFAEIGDGGEDSAATAGGNRGAHRADVLVQLAPSETRTFSSAEFARRWRQQVGDIPGAESQGFSFAANEGGAPAVRVRLSHEDPKRLDEAAEQLAAALRTYNGTYDVRDGSARGKEQLEFQLRPEGRSLGLTERSLAQQVRAAVFGTEALRKQRGRNEVRVYVRRPRSERMSEANLEGLLLRNPEGGEVPLLQAAEVRRSRAYTAISRVQGRRIVDVTAEVDEGAGNAASIVPRLAEKELPALVRKYPGLRYSFEGQDREMDEMMEALGQGFVFALLAMFALLAVAFSSYLQPLIVLSAIPLGMVGAIWGHLLLGHDLSVATMLGVVALSGVVVNDSLVLVDAINRYRRQGMTLSAAVLAAGQRRFRPIALTSLTTFLGLSPMIFETSTQAQILVPMAISLGFGVLFATVVILLIVPCTYLALEDLTALRKHSRG